MNERKAHWEKVYGDKTDEEVSWYQEISHDSLNVIHSLSNSKSNSIIDIGGGNSNLIPQLHREGYTNLSVLDISVKSLQRTSDKMGSKGDEITWIESDILKFSTDKEYNVVHDRATFHFLTDQKDIENGVNTLSNLVQKGGHLIMATFSTSGPKMCSALNITQYTIRDLQQLFKKDFDLVDHFETVHNTPMNTNQEFVYGVFRKR